MPSAATSQTGLLSRPTRARGLKFVQDGIVTLCDFVAPHAGAWIEIRDNARNPRAATVAPHAGAWIEIIVMMLVLLTPVSRAPRGRVD